MKILNYEVNDLRKSAARPALFVKFPPCRHGRAGGPLAAEARERDRMLDPHTTMSLTAVLVLTAVVLVTVLGWLWVVFRAGSQPGGRQARRAAGEGGPAADPGAGPRGQAEPAAHGAGNRA
jgi:hypothetical protein